MNESIKNNIINNNIINKVNNRVDPYKKVAKAMEKQFAEFLVKEMQKTIDRPNSNYEMNYYRGLQNSEYAKAITENNILGVQELILKQIKPTSIKTNTKLPNNIKIYDQE